MGALPGRPERGVSPLREAHRSNEGRRDVQVRFAPALPATLRCIRHDSLTCSPTVSLLAQSLESSRAPDGFGDSVTIRMFGGRF